MGLPPLTFTGISEFSNDFQTILDRAVKIAEIPIRQLQKKDADILERKTLLSGLSSTVFALAEGLRSLGVTAANRALTATSSDTTKVTVSNSGATIATSYTINSITSPATAASERTVGSYADAAATPVSANGAMKLIVGAQEFGFTLATNTLIGLRDKINGLGAGVTASILTTADGNYLAVTANATGATTLQLRDDPDGANTNLLTATNQGTNAVFKLNGIDVTQSGNVVNSVIPGVTFTIVAASATAVTLTLATDRSKIASALQTFVANYNSLRGQVNAHIGPAAGLLTGSSVITQLSNVLREIASYQSSTGSVTNLAALGVVFDSKGVASFDSAKFNALSDIGVSDALAYLGSATTGLGGFSKTLDQIGDPVTGLIQIEQQGLDRSDQAIQRQIAALNERIAVMQKALAAKLHAADALLGALASQQKQLTASLQGLSLTLYGRNRD
jgi:flagellar hook-associated protein 2